MLNVQNVRFVRLTLALTGFAVTVACPLRAQNSSGSAQAQNPPAPAVKPIPLNTTCTRLKVAQMMYEAFKTQLDKSPAARLPHDTPFADVKQNSPAFRAVVVLNEQHVATGSMEGDLAYFHPNEVPSRFDLALALNRLLTALKPTNTESLLAEPLDMPKDIPMSAEAYQSVEKLLKLSILKPFPDGYFRGNRPTTETEVADALLSMKNFVKSKGADKPKLDAKTRNNR